MDPRPAARDSRLRPPLLWASLPLSVKWASWQRPVAMWVRFACAVLHLRSPPLGSKSVIRRDPGPLLATGDLSRPRCLHVENGSQPGVGPTGPDEVSEPGLRNLDHTPSLTSQKPPLIPPGLQEKANIPSTAHRAWRPDPSPPL